MHRTFLGLGSNLGDREANLNKALKMLADTEGIELGKVSAFIETDPVGGPPQGRYLNAVCEIYTDISPRSLLANIHKIEDSLGRTRPGINYPRTVDIDILLYGDEHIKDEGLTVPHPKMRSRNFVMEPLREIAPDIADL